MAILLEECFVYQHRFNPNWFGVLEAVDMNDARQHLGKAYRIKRIELPIEEFLEQGIDRDKRRQIVRRYF